MCSYCMACSDFALLTQFARVSRILIMSIDSDAAQITVVVWEEEYVASKVQPLSL
jgi:hypothetical protein